MADHFDPFNWMLLTFYSCFNLLNWSLLLATTIKYFVENIFESNIQIFSLFWGLNRITKRIFFHNFLHVFLPVAWYLESGFIKTFNFLKETFSFLHEIMFIDKIHSDQAIDWCLAIIVYHTKY